MGGGASSRKKGASNKITAVQAFAGAKKLPAKAAANWFEALKYVASQDVWKGVKREDRPEWNKYLTQAEEIMRKPRQSLSKDVVDSVLSGDLSCDVNNIPSSQPKIVVFVSSTFTDTEAERNLLMRDVYPYLRTLCRRLGIDFGTVDMRWGVTEEATLEHSTVAMCVREIERCTKESVGPSFLCILSHKYGYRPLPAEIEQGELEKMTSFLESSGEDIGLLKSFYNLDANAVPPEYVLKPRAADDKNWWDDIEKIQEQLRKAAAECFQDQEDLLDKYFVSVTETEIHNGIFNNPQSSEQAVVLKRDLNDIRSSRNIHRKLLDMQANEINEDSQSKLQELKQVKLVDNVLQDVVVSLEYKELAECQSYIIDTCDQVCKKFVDQILSNYERHLHIENDSVFYEVNQHRSTAIEKCSLFVGREALVEAITNYSTFTSNGDEGNIMAVCGESGCGKTALVAMAARKSKEFCPNAALILRFIGTTGQSGSARALLRSICVQIARVYNQDTDAIPESFKELVVYFKECLKYANESQPLIIFLDSLDQLTNEDFGKNLSWLPLADGLPPHVRLVVSSILTSTYDILKSRLDQKYIVEVKRLELSEGPEILKLMLEQQHRTLTDEQHKLVLEKFSRCPLPLYLRLATDIALRWRSYDEIESDDIASDMPGLITTLFDRLESRYGKVFVERSLGYICAAKYGVSVNELEDILSCDDTVLDTVFEWWNPPFRRIPQLLWARVRSEIGNYLVERGTNGVSAYSWYHRQFWETAEDRYLDQPSGPFRLKAHEAIADYFEGKWADGKMYPDPANKSPSKGKNAPKLEDRQVPKQPLVLGGTRGSVRQLNRRKLSELVYHLIQLRDWDRLLTNVYDLQYIEAKFEAGFGYDCIGELIEATKESGNAQLKEFTRFIGSNLAFLLREPECVYQVASDLPLSNPIQELIPQGGLPKVLMRDLNAVDIADPCEMTLSGHTETIRCCNYSPKGDMVVSSSDDGTIRLWDAILGAELVTITGLPLPVWPKKEEGQTLMLHPVNPTCFNRTGDMLGNGTEHGEVMLWELSGAQLKRVQRDNKSPASYCKFSPDNNSLAVSFKDGYVGLWTADDLTLQKKNHLGIETTGLDFAPDGSKIAVACLRALAIIDAASFSTITCNKGRSSLTLCCTFTPDGSQIMTGGDDSCVGVWDVTSGTQIDRLSVHRAWIWSIQFTKDGQFMFTSSSDRTFKVWKNNGGNWNALYTLGGHSHRVSMLSIRPHVEDKIVSSALDRTLKIWDMELLKAGKVPPVGGLHYSICVVSPNRKYLATCQGWSKFCNILEADTMRGVSTSPNHNGFLHKAQFTLDNEKLITLDTGHTGAYEAGAAQKAKLKVCYCNGTVVSSALDSVQGPTSFACGKEFIAVGTVEGGGIYLFDSSNLQLIKTIPWNVSGAVSSVAFSPVNSQFAVCNGNTMRILDARSTDSDVIELTGHTTPLYKNEYSSDGRLLVSGDNSGKLLVWECNSGYSKSHTLGLHTAYIKDITFSPSGKYMGTAADLSVRVWDIGNNFALKSVYFGPTNCSAFVSDGENETIVMAGMATGKLKKLKMA